MGRRKLSVERKVVQVILLVDDPAQKRVYEQLEALKDRGAMQEFLRTLLVETFAIKSQDNNIKRDSIVKNNIKIETPEQEDKKPVKDSMAPAQLKGIFQRPAFNPVPKPGGK